MAAIIETERIAQGGKKRTARRLMFIFRIRLTVSFLSVNYLDTDVTIMMNQMLVIIIIRKLREIDIQNHKVAVNTHTFAVLND